MQLNTYTNPPRQQWDALLARPTMDTAKLYGLVQPVLETVKQQGDEALRFYTTTFDGVQLNEVLASATEITETAEKTPVQLQQAITQAAANIRAFHLAQQMQPLVMETMPGVRCWRRQVPIEKVGIYIPGGTAPLFSTVLMLAIPAQIAGCKQIVLCTPPDKEGSLHPAIAFAAQLAGVTCLAKVGGAQAIAAMAYGTESVPAVYKIFGPGNQYVTAAKQLVQQQGVAIDMPAGPSEVCVMADETANPAFVAADLLSQAEHGADSQVLLVATPSFNLQALYDQLAAQLEALPRQHFAAAALANSKALIMDNLEQAIDLVNHYAPEHLIVAMQQCHTVAERITNAGSVFLGNFTPESVGDYASGTNHTLPTNGHARVYAGVSLDSFTKKMTVQELTPEGLNNIAQTVITMAMAEGLEAHARAVEVRKVKSEKGGVKSEE